MPQRDEHAQRLAEAETSLAALLGQEVDAVIGNRDVMVVRLVQAEQALRNSEQRLSAFLENSQVIAWMKDEDGRYVFLSRNFEHRFGVRLADWQGKTDPEIWPPELAEQFRRNDLAVLAAGRPIEFTERARNSDGSVSWWLSCKFLFQDGIAKRFVGGLAVDITQRKQAELELKRAKDELFDFVENATIGIHWVGPDGNILWANRKELEMLGYTKNEYVGRHISEFHADHDVIEDILNRLNNLQEVHEYEARLCCKDGSTIDVIIDSNVYQENGRFVHTRCFTRDVTSRKRAEQALRELNESLEQQVLQRTAMLRLLQDVTRAANEAHTVEQAALAAMQRIADYNGWQAGHLWQLAEDGSGQLVGSGIWYLSEKADQAIGRLQEYQSACEQARISSGEFLVGAVAQSIKPQWIDDMVRSSGWYRGDAQDFGLHAAIAFPVTANDEVVAVMEFFSDHAARRDSRFMEIMPDVGIQLGHVIERKRLEKEVADSAEREQRRIGSDIHDGVGQELTGLRYLATAHVESLAEQSSPDAAAARRILQAFETVQKHLRGIIKDLVPVEVDEQGFLVALQSLVERTSDAHDVECSFECEQPIAIEDNLLATHVYRIAQEAVNNAVRHSSADRLVIRIDANDGKLNLQIVDDGVGIGPEPFKRAGFGLRTMRFRAHLIGARLTIEARNEGGTSVTCEVPTRQSD